MTFTKSDFLQARLIRVEVDKEKVWFHFAFYMNGTIHPSDPISDEVIQVQLEVPPGGVSVRTLPTLCEEALTEAGKQLARRDRSASF